jgi:hypothetical protein
MNFQKYLHPLVFIPFLLLLLVQTSCEKFSGDQTIPAYLKIDSIRLQTVYSTQGTASHNITDAWVYIDGDFIGTFQLPARFPVLKQGPHTVEILPGIKKDGIASTRVNYPFFGKISKSITLTPDTTTNIGLLTAQYSTSTKFLWREDFDDLAITLDTTKATMVKVALTPPDSPLTFEGLHSGMITMDTAHPEFECVSHQTFYVPNSQTFLELNFKSTTTMDVGVYLTVNTIVYQTSVLTLFASPDKWKKIYIDLTNALNANTGTTNFRVYFYSKNTGTTTETIFLDNIKLLSF